MRNRDHIVDQKPGASSTKSRHGSATTASGQDKPVGQTPQTESRPGAARSRTETPGSPPGLDAQRHAASQRHAHHAELIRDKVFPTLMATALSLHGAIEPGAFQVYLQRLREDAGNPTDPIQCMLIEQVCLAHFRIGQLHARAAEAETVDAIKALTAATARLLGEMRRTALALTVINGRVPAGKSGPNLKIFKDAM